ncbi:MAG: hypothetical protein MHMPM18_000942 [Marteilia pararefringens]
MLESTEHSEEELGSFEDVKRAFALLLSSDSDSQQKLYNLCKELNDRLEKSLNDAEDKITVAAKSPRTATRVKNCTICNKLIPLSSFIGTQEHDNQSETICSDCIKKEPTLTNKSVYNDIQTKKAKVLNNLLEHKDKLEANKFKRKSRK